MVWNRADIYDNKQRMNIDIHLCLIAYNCILNKEKYNNIK